LNCNLVRAALDSARLIIDRSYHADTQRELRRTTQKNVRLNKKRIVIRGKYGGFIKIVEKKNFLQGILTEHGYFDWWVIDRIELIPSNYFLLINPKEKKIGELAIPREWFDDPPRRSAIGELLASTIHNCSYALPRAQLRASNTYVERHNSLSEEDRQSNIQKTTASHR
jgi:hypothetical protein